MPYLKRDSDGRIRAIVDGPVDGVQEPVPPHDPEVAAFLAGADSQSTEVQEGLLGTDEAMARVTEDLVQLLVHKHLIAFTEMPRAAQQILLAREKLRGRLSALVDLVGEDDVL